MSDQDPIEVPSQEPPPAAAPQPAAPPPPSVTLPPIPERAPQKKGRKGVFFLGALSGCLVLLAGLVVIAVVVAAMSGDSSTDELHFGSKIAIVPIEGEILEARETLDALHRYADNSSVRGIVVRINSPGGAIAPSQEIYEEIRKIRQKSGKPIVASVDSVGASGGFYIASACDEIVANPGSITGSIGVILEWMNTKDLVTWAKMKPEMITSGTLKATGSPYKDLTPEERNYLQRIVLQLHQQFVKAVAQGRHGRISEEEVGRIADGRIFTGEEALGLKLIDRLGNLDDAVQLTAKLAHMKGTPSTIYPKRRKAGLFDVLTNSDDAEAMLERVLNQRASRFLYRW